MGVGRPIDIINAVEKGVDMFDCVLPTRSGRNGQAFTSLGPINIKNAKYVDPVNIYNGLKLGIFLSSLNFSKCLFSNFFHI
mgnify:CR=1 FL=1